ncbi:hypothetical protein L9F63_002165 [Diploptera punctata]|uniref:Ionotropic glutamate receptor L-glutamate and glycine-binding domain-containing protein n=1 Tax=Diploptera punctata TaxID=6984 RepID=A0AAD8A2P2_DIPPU|nr:hypothetical protein L9F63_002165 [Diploptera punctata]
MPRKMKTAIVIIVIFTLISTASTTLEIDNYIEETKLFDELFEDETFWLTMSHHFNFTRTLTFIIQEFDHRIWNITATNLILKIQTNLKIPVEIFWFGCCVNSVYGSNSSTLEYILEYPSEYSHSYIIVAIDYIYSSTFLSSYEELKRNWTSKDNYVVLILSHNEWNTQNSGSDITIFEQFWTLGMLKTIIIQKCIESTNKQNDRIIIYDPFVTDKEKRLISVKTNDVSHLPKTYLERSWDLKGHTLKVTMFHSFPNAILKRDSENEFYEGIDWDVISNLAKFMNFKIDIITPQDGKNFGYRLDSGEFTGAMRDLINGFADISGNGRYIKYYNTNKIEFILPAFYTNKIVVIVPSPLKLSSWETIAEHLSLQFLFYLLILFITCTALWYLLRKLHGKVFYLTNILDMLSIFLTMPLNFLTKVTSNSQRIFLSFCMLFSLTVMCLLQSSLLDAMSHPHYEDDIDTLKDLDESGLRIATFDPNFLDTFDESLYMENLNSKIFYTNLSLDRMIHIMIDNRNVSLLISNSEAKWLIAKYPRMIHVVPEYPREYFVSYMIPKGSAYATRIHYTLGKICAAGLVVKWDEDSSYKLRLKALKERTVDFASKKSPKVFKLVDFQFAFVVFSVGITASCIILLVENLTRCENKIL